jgi:mono/diheme cytochrome c family protein
MKISVTGTLLVFTAALPLIVTGKNPATRQDRPTTPAVDGAKIFRNNCVACHGGGCAQACTARSHPDRAA